MKSLLIRLRDWWRGYTDRDMSSMRWKMLDPDLEWPACLTPGEARAWIQFNSAD